MSGKKSFLEKIGMVESVEEQYTPEQLDSMLNESRAVEVPEGINVDDLISVDDVYAKANMTDINKSIFKVDEMSKVKGIAELPTDVKRMSVTGVLSAAGLDVDSLVQDGVDRVNALGATLTAFTDETNSIVEENESLIKDLEAKIDEAKKTINNRKVLQEQQEKLFKEESDKIDQIVKFIKPVI